MRALWARYRSYRARFVAAVTCSTINKIADVAPEVIIGAAVDVVVVRHLDVCWQGPGRPARRWPP